MDDILRGVAKPFRKLEMIAYLSTQRHSYQHYVFQLILKEKPNLN